jgi:histidinol-phosphate aminotransferase
MSLLDLSLNNGSRCSEHCIDILRRKNDSTALSGYSDAGNSGLQRAIAESIGSGIGPGNIYLHNGSGPILKQVIPHVIRSKIKSSPWRMLRHLLQKRGYTLIAPYPTYSKIPDKAAASGLSVQLLELRPEDDFKLSADRVAQTLKRGDGLVYLCNPNNPTGQILLSPDKIAGLAERFPQSFFWVDEAYIEYLEGSRSAELVARYPNVACLRSFSFAHGLASIRFGYLVASEKLVKESESQVTEYRVGGLAEELALAALRDDAHLVAIRRESAVERSRFMALNGLGGIEFFESSTNFILGRALGQLSAQQLALGVRERGILIKTFEPNPSHPMEKYFRITLGTSEENSRLIAAFQDVLR